MVLSDLVFILATLLVFLSVKSMVIPPPPDISADDPELTNSLTTAFPPVGPNGTMNIRRKRCQRPLIIIFYSRSSTLPPFRALPSNGRLRSASSRRAEKLTQDEKTAMQKCLKKYGEITQICDWLTNMTSPITEDANSTLARIAERILE